MNYKGREIRHFPKAGISFAVDVKDNTARLTFCAANIHEGEKFSRRTARTIFNLRYESDDATLKALNLKRNTVSFPYFGVKPRMEILKPLTENLGQDIRARIKNKTPEIIVRINKTLGRMAAEARKNYYKDQTEKMEQLETRVTLLEQSTNEPPPLPKGVTLVDLDKINEALGKCDNCHSITKVTSVFYSSPLNCYKLACTSCATLPSELILEDELRFDGGKQSIINLINDIKKITNDLPGTLSDTKLYNRFQKVKESLWNKITSPPYRPYYVEAKFSFITWLEVNQTLKIRAIFHNNLVLEGNQSYNLATVLGLNSLTPEKDSEGLTPLASREPTSKRGKSCVPLTPSLRSLR